MNRGKRDKIVINSLLLERKINTHVEDASFIASKQVSFIVTDKFDIIVKLLKIVLLISFKAIIFLVNQIFDGTAFSPLENFLIEKSFYFKGFNSININFYKNWEKF